MTEASIIIEDLGSTQNKVIKLVKVAGQLDESNIDEKIQVVYKLVEENPRNLNLILDFVALDYMNSKSIGYLTDIYGKITESGGQMAIAQGKPNIIDILQVVGLTQLIRTFGSLEEAKNYIDSQTTTINPTPVAQASQPATQQQVAPTTPTAPAATPEPAATPTTPPPAQTATIEPVPMSAAPQPQQNPETSATNPAPAPTQPATQSTPPDNSINLNQ